MGNGALGVGVEVVCYGMARQGLEGGLTHELLGVCRHGHTNLAARLLQPAQDLAGLIGRDPAADAEKNVAPAAPALATTPVLIRGFPRPRR